MNARRVVGVVMVAALSGLLPAAAAADQYPPSVNPSEVVTDDVLPTETDVKAEEVVRPASSTAALSSTGIDASLLLGAALAALLAGGGLAAASRRRRDGGTA